MIKRNLSILVLSVIVLFINTDSLTAQEKDWVWAKHGAEKVSIDNNDNLIFFIGLTITKKDVNENQLWSFAGTGDGNIVEIDTDILGNIYVLGNFTNSVAFGAESLISSSAYSSGFLFKFNSDGVFISKRIIEGNSIVKLNGLDIDANQNVAVIGDFAGVNVDFGNGFALSNHYICKDGTADCLFSEYEYRFPFIVKIGADNNAKWVSELIVGLIWRWDYSSFRNVAFDNNGDLLLAAFYQGFSFHWNSSHDQYTWGDFYSSIDKPTGCGFSPKESFLIKLDSDGRKIWAKQIASSNIQDILSDGNNFIVSGSTGNSLRFKDGSLVTLNASGGFFMKMNPLGTVEGARSLGVDAGFDLPVSLDGSGNIFISGSSWGNPVDFLPTSFVDKWHRNIFIAKYNPLFEPQWIKWAGGDGWDQIYDIDVISGGDVYATGNAHSSSLFRLENRITLQSPSYFNAKISEICTPVPHASIHCNGDCTGETEVTVDFNGTAPYTYSYAIGGEIQPEITTNESSVQILTDYEVYSIANISDVNCSGTFEGEMHMAIAEMISEDPSFIQSESSGLYLNSPIKLEPVIQGDYSATKWYLDSNNDGILAEDERIVEYKGTDDSSYPYVKYHYAYAMTPGTYYLVVTPLSGSDIVSSVVLGSIMENNKTRDLIHNGDFENQTKQPFGGAEDYVCTGGFWPDCTTGGFEFETDCYYETNNPGNYIDISFEVIDEKLWVGAQNTSCGHYTDNTREGKYDWKQDVTLKTNTNYRFAFDLYDGFKTIPYGYCGPNDPTFAAPIIDFGFIDNEGNKTSLLEKGCLVKSSTDEYEFVETSAGVPLRTSNQALSLRAQVMAEFNSGNDTDIKMYITNKAINNDYEGTLELCYMLDNISMLNVDEKVPAVTLDLVHGICQPGDQAQIDFTFTGEKLIRMEYTINNGTPIVVDNITDNVYTINTDVLGEYKVTKISNYLGDGFEFGIPVTVIQGVIPEPQIESNEDEILANICSDQASGTVTLSVTDAVSSDPYKLVIWFKDLNGNNLLDNGEMLAISPTLEVTESGTYHVEVESVAGCTAVTSIDAFNVLGGYATFAVKNDNATGTGSLRAAIEASNVSWYEPRQIIFCDKGTPYHIVLSDTDGPLPEITRSVIIDATNLPDLVEIESNLTTDANGFTINADDTEISGFYIHGFTGLTSHIYGQTTGCGIATEQHGNITIRNNVLSGNNCGIFADDHRDMIILGNYIGTDVTGTTAIPNKYGIFLNEQGSGTNEITIGGCNQNDGNIITGNSEGGIFSGRGTYSTYIIGNKIGVNINNEVIGNGSGSGIYLFTAWNNIIGGSEEGAQNIIAGANEGIFLGVSDGGCHNNTISRNSIFGGTKGIHFDTYGGFLINENKQPPTITGGSSNDGTVSGTSDWGVTAHLGDIVELFRSDINGINAFEYIGEAVVQDGGTWTATNVNLTTGEDNYVIATITDVKDYNTSDLENTSEFSGMYIVVPLSICPVITSISPSEVCHDQNATFGFTNTGELSGETYFWDLGDGTTSTEKNPVHTYTTPGDYQVTLTITMANCDNITFSTDITVNYELAISGLASQYYIDNQPKVIIGTPVGGVFTGTSVYYNSETEVYTFIPEAVGVFDITYTYTNGSCSNSLTQQVPVIDAIQVCPTITSISPLAVCHDEEVTFTFTNTGVFENETYLWNLGDGTTSVEKNPVHSYANPGTYPVSLKVSMDDCNDAVYNIDLVVNYEVAIIGLSSEFLHWSESVLLNGTPTGGVFSGNEFVNDLGSGIYTFSPEELGDQDITYTYTVGFCSNSVTQKVNVYEETHAYLSGNVILCNGSTTTDVIVNYTGTGEWSFICNHTDNLGQITPITQAGITASSYTITGCTQGYYTLVSVQDINGVVATGGPLSVVSRPSPVALLGGSGTVCREEEAPVFIDFTNGSPPYNFTYKIGDLGTEQSGTSYNERYDFTDPVEGTYYLLSISDFNCPGAASGIVDVSFNDLPDVSITGLQTSYCEGDPLVTFIGNPAGGYYSGFGFTSNGDGTASFNPITKGIYRLTYTYTNPETGCTNSASQFVRVNGIPTATLSGDGKICGEGSTKLNVELSGADSYMFTYTDGSNTFDVTLTESMLTSNPFNYPIEVSTEGDYSLTHVESGGCIGTIGSDIITVVKHAIPTATIANGIDETICQGETTPVTVSFTGDGGWTYRLGINNSFVTSEIFTIENPKVYDIGFNGITHVITVRDQYCEGIGQGSAIINVLPVPSAELTGDGAICEGETAVMTVEFLGTGPWYFKYSVDGVEIPDEITIDIPPVGELANYIIEANDPAEYKLEYVRNNECSGTVSGIINVENYPKPTISMSGGGEIYLEEQAEIQFALTGYGPYIIGYAIDGVQQFPPILIPDTNPDLLYTYFTDKPGIYTIVNFQDAHCEGDEVLDEVTVTIIGEPLPCKECISSFAPIPGEKYVISAWIKQTALSTNGSYADAGIEIEFEGANEITDLFLAKGAIIDSWQRVEEEFVIPFGTTAIHVKLTNNSTLSVFFDDIRIHPFKANMKSYVYDPITMKLSAELDENNYATYYEYNEEGALIRIKKETERGVKTIQESFSNKAKPKE